MKYGLIIQDLDAAGVAEVLGKLNGDLPVGEITVPVNIETTVTPAAPAAPAATPMAETQQRLEQMLDSNEDVETDSKGLPWDERIHATTKTKTKKGEWKKRKGVDKATIAKVEEELQSSTTPAAPAVAEAPAVATAPAAPAVAPAPAAAPSVMDQPIAPPSRDFQGLMQQLSNLNASGSVDANYPNTIVQRINSGFNVTIGAVTDIAANPQYVEYAWQCLEVDGKAA